MRMKAEIEVLKLQVKEHQTLPTNHQKPGRDKEGLSSSGFRGTVALPNLDFGQNYRRINFYCPKSPSLWDLITASLGN